MHQSSLRSFVSSSTLGAVTDPVYNLDRSFILIQLMDFLLLKCLGKRGDVSLIWVPINLAYYPTHEHGGQKRSFKAKWFDLPQAKEWLSTHQRQTPCTALLVECLLHQELLRKVGFHGVLELQIGKMLQEESETMQLPNIITIVHWH